MSEPHPFMVRSGRSLATVVMIAALLAACSGSGATSTPGASTGSGPTTSEAASPLSTGPAAFQLTVTGDANVTGTWGSSYGIGCNNPTLEGSDLYFFGAAPDGKAVVLITVNQGSIGVSERAGAGSTFTDREFAGTGVTSFDPARGASFDSDVTIVPAPGQAPGTLGTITHLAGSVDCGNQRPGTSSVVVSGASAEGAFSGPFIRFRVVCNLSQQNGDTVSISAVVNAGAAPTFFIINLPAARTATIYSPPNGQAPQHFYNIAASATLTTSKTGAHLDADFVESLPSGSTASPHTIHLAGDVTCGTTNTS